MNPTAELLDLPPAYGKPKTTLDWDGVRDRIESSERYWVATTRPDGRPHAVPIDGVWLDGRLYFGGAPETVSMRNLQANPEVVMHLEDALRAVIVEGNAEWVTPSPEDAARLVEASKAKYGYSVIGESGTWSLHPRRALAWTQFPKDCTRFTFA
jgi:nitroimidazol reductase NimA-like FMN-containing flavoprotein (pyridoxamine 5'-phosphate oxidase superfamily)